MKVKGSNTTSSSKNKVNAANSHVIYLSKSVSDAKLRWVCREGGSQEVLDFWTVVQKLHFGNSFRRR